MIVPTRDEQRSPETHGVSTGDRGWCEMSRVTGGLARMIQSFQSHTSSLHVLLCFLLEDLLALAYRKQPLPIPEISIRLVRLEANAEGTSQIRLKTSRRMHNLKTIISLALLLQPCSLGSASSLSALVLSLELVLSDYWLEPCTL